MMSNIFNFDDFETAFRNQPIIHYKEAIYRGEVDSKSRPNGNGIMIYSDGTINEGNFVKGSREGVNYLKRCNGNTFLGTFRNDCPNGYGTETLNAEQTLYYGYMKDGLKHGRGTLNYKDGTVYKGEFLNGVKQEGNIEKPKDKK